LSLQFISGFVLALSVVLIGILLQEKRESDVKKSKLIEDSKALENILKNVFKRGASNWNFRNSGPTFYFDIGWINSLYSLLTENSRFWDLHIQEYLKQINSEDKLNLKLASFINCMETALIDAEKLDNKLKFSRISPALAASMGSGYSVDRDEAQKRAEFDFWIYRATWAGANATQIMFGFSFFTQQQLTIEKIQSIVNEAKALAKEKNYKELIDELGKNQKKLDSHIKNIEKLTNN